MVAVGVRAREGDLDLAALAGVGVAERARAAAAPLLPALRVHDGVAVVVAEPPVAGGDLHDAHGAERARRALGDGREDLGTEAAIHIAALEDERADRRAAAERFAAEVERLKRLVAQGGERLRDLDRGLQTARTTEALRRAGLEGRRATTLSAGALGEAERTLERLRARQAAEADVAAALTELEAEATGGIEADLEAAGYGRPRTDPRAVLDRLRAGT